MSLIAFSMNALLAVLLIAALAFGWRLERRLKALRDSLGETYSAEVEQAWGAVYGDMAEIMIAAQNAVPGTAATPDR